MDETITPSEVNGEVCRVCRDSIPTMELFADDIASNAYVPGSGMYRGDTLCGDCYHDRYFTCDSCEREFDHDNYAEDGLCHDCYNEQNDNSEDSDALIPTNVRYAGYLGTSAGRVIKSLRPFGVEVECISPTTSWYSQLPDAFGVTTDGSVTATEGGHELEMVTPPLAGLTGEKVLRKALALMNANEVTVNNSCGLHVHLDGKGYRAHDVKGFRNLRSLMLFYKEFDEVFRAMIPRNRRRSTFCKPTSTYGTTIQAARTYAALERIWYSAKSNMEANDAKAGGKYHESRYHAVNLHPLLSRQRAGVELAGTIEIRLHSGTTNADKILKWVALHQKVLDTFTKKELTPKVLDFIRKDTSLEHKVRCLKTVLKLSPLELGYIETRITKFSNGN